MLGALFGWLYRFVGASYDWLFEPIDKKRSGGGTHRNALLEAREDLGRQITILAMGPVNYRDVTPQRERLLADLRHALSEIEDEISRLP